MRRLIAGHGGSCHFLGLKWLDVGMPARNVVLSPDQEQRLRDLVVQGRYQNVSEVIRAGVHLVLSREAEEQARSDGLRGPIAVCESGMENGDVEVYGLD